MKNQFVESIYDVFVGVISNDCSCKKLMLSTENEDTHLWQNSKLGLYEKQNYDVNNRIVYYNPIKKQYLFWESSRDGYWLVSNYLFGCF